MHTLEQHFQVSKLGVDKFMHETIQTFLINNHQDIPTNDDRIKFLIILSIFGYEISFKTIENLILDIFIVNGKFRINKDIVLGRIMSHFSSGSLDFIDKDGNLRLYNNSKYYIFGTHVRHDWKKRINANYSLKEILEGIVYLLYGDNYTILTQVISNNLTFKKKYEIISSIQFLSHFRSIFLFDFIKINHYFSQGNTQISVSKDIEDYIIERDYFLFGRTVKSYLLSSYDTLAYNKTDSDSLEMIKLKYGEDTNFIFYLEDALCWYGKEMRGIDVNWRFE